MIVCNIQHVREGIKNNYLRKYIRNYTLFSRVCLHICTLTVQNFFILSVVLFCFFIEFPSYFEKPGRSPRCTVDQKCSVYK